MSGLRFTDLEPPGADLRDAVIGGLAARPRSIPPKFFYDARGSRIFDAICAQPEYYLPAAEREILVRHRDEIAAAAGRGCVLIEPGAGSSVKVRLLLDALRPAAYAPLDICGEHLRASCRTLARDYPWLPIHAARADFCHRLTLPGGLPAGRRVVFFPGSSLSNFDPPDAVAFLENVRALAGEGGGLLIGVDCKKDPAVLHAAYNDAAGATAAFNLNLLHRIRRELDAELEPERFSHRAFYNEKAGRVEMHLESRVRQRLRIDGHRFYFEGGESIHSENSYKYHPEEFRALAARAGFRPRACWRDARRLFSVHYLEVGPDSAGGAPTA